MEGEELAGELDEGEEMALSGGGEHYDVQRRSGGSCHIN